MAKKRITPMDHESIMARKAHIAGLTRAEFITARRAAIARAATNEHAGEWSRAELAAAFADVTMAADAVWGTPS